MAEDSGVGLVTVIVTVTKHLIENLEESFLLACVFPDSVMQSWAASCLARPMGRQNAMATEQRGVADKSSLYHNGQEAVSCPGRVLYFFQLGSAS